MKLERLSSSKFKSGDLKRVVTARKVTGKKKTVEDDMVRSEEGRLDTFLAKLRRRLLSK